MIKPSDNRALFSRAAIGANYCNEDYYNEGELSRSST